MADISRTDVVIIGAGLSGLSCAIGLLGSRLDVVLVEESSSIGGRARSWVDEGTRDEIDIGPHVLTNEHRNMLRLLDSLGTRQDVVWHRDNFLILVDEAPVVMKRYPLPAPLALLPSLFTVPTLSFRDLASNTRVVSLAMRLGEEDIVRLDTLVAEDFLKRMGVRQAFIDWFWKSASMTFMNVPLERCSAGALMRVFKQILGDRRFQFGFPAKGLGDLFAAVSARRIASEGGRIVMEREVQGFVHHDDTVSGVILNDGSRVETRFCVSAIPPQSLRRITPKEWANRHAVFRDLSAFDPVPYISSYIWFDRRLTKEQMWTRVWAPKNLNYDFYDLSNIRPQWRHRPSVVASNIIHSQRAEGLTDDEIIQATVREISEFLPQAADANILHARVNRIPMAIAAPYPGMERKRPDTHPPIRGLILAGDWTNTHFPSTMESAVRSGWLAAEQIWAEMGKPRQLALPMQETGGIARLFRWWAMRKRGAIAAGA